MIFRRGEDEYDDEKTNALFSVASGSFATKIDAFD
jgi:hypothetical protein